MSTFLHCDRKNRIFFKKLKLFHIEFTSWHFFFEIHNPNKKWLEISVFENSIIRWVYKVVKEALKKSEKIYVVFFSVIVNTHEVVAKSKRVRYKRLSIICEITNIYIFYLAKNNLRSAIFLPIPIHTYPKRYKKKNSSI